MTNTATQPNIEKLLRSFGGGPKPTAEQLDSFERAQFVRDANHTAILESFFAGKQEPNITWLTEIADELLGRKVQSPAGAALAQEFKDRLDAALTAFFASPRSFD